MNIFKPGDFAGYTFEQNVIANKANTIFTEWIEKNGVRVYGVIDPADELGNDFIMGTKNDTHDTHQAILIDIQEIVKPKCEHSVAASKLGDGHWQYTNNGGAFFCGKCGAHLKPTGWEVVDE